MSALPCTKHRHAVMTMVVEGDIVATPHGDSWRWHKRVSDLFPIEQDEGTVALTSAQSKAVSQLFAAGLIRRSAAAVQGGRRRGQRSAVPTDAGRDWWTKGYRARRGCSNTNARGNSESRRRRRQWLLDTYGDGTTAPCWLAVPGVCIGQITAETLSVERVRPAHAGGTYRRDNIRPACAPCQSHQGGQFGIEQVRHREAGRRAHQLIDA